MKKRILALMLVLCLLFALCGCFSRGNDSGKRHDDVSDDEENRTDRETDHAPVNDAPIPGAEYLPDFTVATVDGGTFTLSEALETHELVLVNLFATWCGPCKMEFPYLQEAWEQTQDRVAVVALSVEPTDSLDTLRDFAAEQNLSFPMGQEDGADLRRFVTEGIPTTLVVDRTGKLAAVEVGAKQSTQEFLDLFDRYTGEDYDPSLCTYTVYVYNYTTGDYAEGIVINFCTDTACTPVTTDADGVASFTGMAAKYHVQIVNLPDGLQVYGEGEWETEPYGQTFRAYLLEVGQ